MKRSETEYLAFVRHACREWGRQRWKAISDPTQGWENMSLLGRIREEQEGAGQGYFRQRFRELYTGVALDVHRAVQGMPHLDWYYINLKHVLPGKDSWKIKKIGVSRDTFYAKLGRAERYVAERLDRSDNF